jgi:predicted nucleic acid-binding protein
VLAFLNDEPEAQKVQELLDQAKAGRFKTTYSMSLADSIAVATAISIDAALVTKDSEMQVPEKAGEFSVLWLK